MQSQLNDSQPKMPDETQALLWQGFFAVAMFVSTFASYLLPIIVFSRRNRRLQCNDFSAEEDLNLPHHWSHINLTNQLKKYKLKRLLSYCNCVSAGVFLGVCFLNLVPCVEKEFDKLLKDFSSLKQFFGTFPLGQFTVICGLFFVLILESLLSGCFEDTKDSSSHPDSTTPILYLDDESNEPRSDLTDERSYDQEELLLSNEVNVRQPNGNNLNHARNGLNAHANTPDHLLGHGHHHHGHGHAHSHLTPDFFNDRPYSMLSFFILMFATSVHSLFEGLALGLQSDISNAIHLFIGIILHECLVAIALGLNAVRLQQQNINLWMHIKFAFFFSITIPTGNLFGILLGYTPGHVGRFISAIFQGFAAGTFIHVTFLELIPEELLSPDSDSKEDELARLIDNNQADIASGGVTVQGSTTGEHHQSHANGRSSTTSLTNDEHGHSHHIHPDHSHIGNVKLRKILLLLFGYIIMALVPFIFRD